MYFTNGSSRAFEMLMRGKPGFDRYENGGCADCEDCNTCHFYRPHWKYQFAYTVCQHFGLDTSDYSFGYVAGWSSGRDIKELKASLETIRTAASKLISEIEGHFAELQAQHTAEQEQAAAQDVPENTFSIYQLKDGDATRDLRFEPLEQVKAAGLRVDRENYELVYTAPLSDTDTLEDIFVRFNMDRPQDFTGHSLSMSDVIVLHRGEQETAH